ncbi:putative endo-1,3(4)-beta-glucanase [Penicillium oxalicum]|uniref:putative endo-1,3(4)-beta-glucanase n=1 Tax=Penicillium oxalicum TaxID=69781 RepID=UPI0020B777F2|nr:putative endo-1,3(4)-beta-glucanase [Penicillium oxalicum]KAI2790612.1 putative endo-1,3(4)-beta-glucanase [Penicillium oxalicum]
MRSFSPSLSAGSLFLALLAAPVATATEKYQLVENWQGDGFLDYFNFHVGSDPTKGFVQYVDESHARDAGLLRVTETGSVYIGVDHKTTLKTTDQGRESVRIGTKKFYDHSLVIADLAHMPASTCGTWPAFWSVGKNWPHDGEIDIIEGVNMQNHNEIVMHTAGTCSITETGMTGAVNATGCGEDLGTVGCVIEGHEGSYGTSFNKQGGGVYAMEWTEKFVKIWFFARASIPASITSGQPDVTEFGTPMALVQDACDVASSFKSQSFIFDTTFCGEWAGNVYGKSGCPMAGSDPMTSCVSYVAQNPAAFEQSYWEINSVKIYQTGVAANAILQPVHSSVSTHSTAQEATIATAPAHPVQSTMTAPEAPPASQTHSAPQVTDVPHTTAVAPGATGYRSVPGPIVETLAGQDSTSSPATSMPTDVPNPVTPAGTVGELGADGVSVAGQPEQSPTKQSVTKFVTSTTTLCPIAESSASAAHMSQNNAAPEGPVVTTNAAHIPATTTMESIVSAPSITTQPAQQIQTQPAAVITAMSVPADVLSSGAHVPDSTATGLPNGADPVAATESGNKVTSDRPLPTIIPAPGVSIGSGSSAPAIVVSHAKPTPMAIATANDIDFAAASSMPGSSSTAAAPVFTPFTGAAGRASVQLSGLIAAFMVGLVI